LQNKEGFGPPACQPQNSAISGPVGRCQPCRHRPTPARGARV